VPDELSLGDLRAPAISADGLHVAFVAQQVLGTDTFPTDVVFVYDRDIDADGVRDEPTTDPALPQSGVVRATSGAFTPIVALLGDSRTDPLQDTESYEPAISGDGSTVVYSFEQFYEFNTDAEPVDMPGMRTPLPIEVRQIVVVDRNASTGELLGAEIASMSGPGKDNPVTRNGIVGFDDIYENAGQCLSGAEGCGDSDTPDLSDDGRYVTFATDADNLVVDPLESLPGTSFCGDGGACDIVAVDRTAASNGGGPQHVNQPPVPVLDLSEELSFVDRQVLDPAISGDGRFVTFTTGAEYLLGYEEVEVEPDLFETQPVDENLFADIYLREWQPVVDPSLPVGFPATQVGTTSAAQSAGASTQDFGPAPILAVELTGANPGDFLIIDALNCLPPLPGAPPPVAAVPAVPTHGRVQLGNGCSVFVAFRPTDVGVRNAILRVTTGHPFSVPGTAPQIVDIPLTGGGAGQGGFGAQATFDLGSQIVTTTSPEIAIPITNTGNTPFQITDITIGGTNPGDFTIVGTDCIGFLAPGASCTVRVTFTPTAPGERSAILIFTDTALGGPHAIGLTGRAPFPTLILNPGVIVAGRTVQVQGFNWAPGQVITITTADAFSQNPNDPAAKFPERLEVIANPFGGIDGTLLLFPKSSSGPRIVIADGPGAPPALSAFQPLLVAVATISGVDFISRG
jgi:hypothetical protein